MAKKKMGRPRKEVDFNVFEGLCEILCTEEEIAHAFKMDIDTLNARIKEKYGETFSEVYKLYSAKGKISIRRKQVEVALSGNTSLLIWVGKQMLGQKEKSEISGQDGKPIEHKVSLEKLGDGDIDDIIKSINQK